VQISCPSCRKAFSLDDSKVPAKPVTMKCPACGGGIPVGPQVQAEEEAWPPAAQPPPPPPEPQVNGQAPRSLAPAEWDRLKQEVTVEVLKHLGVKVADSGQDEEENGGEQRALVCDDEELFQAAIRSVLDRRGYKVEAAPDTAVALDKVMRGSYDIVTVDNRFPDNPEGGLQILQAINALPPDTRRKMYVAFISADLGTMDTNSAFILGANITVSKKDIRRLDKVLADGIREHEKVYRVFHQVLEEIHRQEE
jgi:predicted Zn finger-like uncharacterized protein